LKVIAMKVLPLAALVLATAVPGHASAGLVLDGNLDDWQINRTTLVSALPGVHSTIEDSTGGTDVRLYPGWGGQAYDAEALYATIQDGSLWIALITGHNWKYAGYGAGDFAIDFGKNGSYDLGINVIPGGFGVAGGVYSHPTWALGLWNTAGVYDPAHPDPAHPTSLTGGTLLGSAQYKYTDPNSGGVAGYGAYQSDKHYIYELSVDVGLLRQAGWDGSAFNIHWTENCANDSIMVDPGKSVPEPGSMVLLGAGMIGLIGVRRKAPIPGTVPAAG
jgi:hypothetical protein